MLARATRPGDRRPALRSPRADRAEKIDLGEAWKALTGLPFVYAAWTGREGVLDEEQVNTLQAARARGEAELDAIARETAAEDVEGADKVLRYLRDTLRYGLGDREVAGLERFHELAVEMGLAPARRPIRFFP
jgi:chorismate dehydratase